MLNNAEEFKAADEAFAKKHEAKQKLESYITTVSTVISDEASAAKLKKSALPKVQEELTNAFMVLQEENASTEVYRKAEIALKRAYNKATSSR